MAVGLASGDPRKLGQAVGNFDYSGLALGTTRVVGSAVGALGFTGLGVGTPKASTQLRAPLVSWDRQLVRSHAWE